MTTITKAEIIEHVTNVTNEIANKGMFSQCYIIDNDFPPAFSSMANYPIGLSILDTEDKVREAMIGWVDCMNSTVFKKMPKVSDGMIKILSERPDMVWIASFATLKKVDENYSIEM